ncbi:trehalose receptor domain-containing protein [Phthorimaea operculella]|nr:trehalose receptor domain-containing protein [Phthorimaea operculella]
MELDEIGKGEDQNHRHYENFKEALNPLLLWGQFWGLVPVYGITEKDPSHVRFRLGSLRFCFSLFLAMSDAVFACLFIYIITRYSNDLVLFFLYASNCLVTLLSMWTAFQWSMLAKEVSSSNLDVHPCIKKKSIMTVVIFFGIAFVEYIVAVIRDVTHVLDCLDFDDDIFTGYIQKRFEMLFIVGLPYHFTVGIILQSLPSSAWRELREAYTRASRLVRTFDSAINQVTFVSFSTSFLFVLLKLFFVLTPFHGYEQSIYFVISLFTVLLRAIALPLIAAQVHCESKSALPALYRIPTKNYCSEVQRLIEQIQGDTVTLTGSNFFCMTRDLVLTQPKKILENRIKLIDGTKMGLHEALGWTLICSRMLGLNPVTGLLKPSSELKYTLKSPFTIVYTITLIGQVMLSTMSFYWLFVNGMTLPNMMEHSLSLMYGHAISTACNPLDEGEMFFVYNMPWIFQYIPYHLTIGIMFEVTSISLTSTVQTPGSNRPLLEIALRTTFSIQIGERIAKNAYTGLTAAHFYNEMYPLVALYDTNAMG